jgi:ATP-binding cassette subfamily C exporter for protease/lipase
MTMLDQKSELEAPVRRILTQARHSFYLAFAISGVVEIISLAPILYMWNVFDRVITARSGITLVSLTIVVVAIYMFWALLDWLRNRLFVQLSAKLDWDLSASVFDASFRRYVGYNNVNLHQLLSDLLILRQALTGRPVLALMDAPFAIVFIAVGFVFHPLLALFVALASGAILMTSFVAQRASAPALKASNEENAAANKVAADSLRQAEVTMAMGMLPAVRRKWFVRHQKFLQLQVNASEASGTMRGFSTVLGNALPSLQVALGAWLAIEGAITGGMVIAASMLIGKAMSPLNKLIGEWNQIISARQAYDRLNDLLTDDLIYGEQMALPAPVGNLVVNGLVIIPPGTANIVLNGLSFTMKPGELLAVIGPSAAGKTCLARALMGVWKPHQGSVRLDGVEISDWAHEELGPYLGYVPQEIEFLQATVAENIARLGELDPEKVIAATKLIGAHEMVLKMPNGYDTKIGPGGYVLSGGQKQMMALARAFYGSPSFIVLDEPNSNLDDAAEQAFKKALQAICQAGSAVVVMTHDPNVARLADLLLVLREGRQVGFGPSAQLLEAVRMAAAPTATPARQVGVPEPTTAPAVAKSPAQPTSAPIAAPAPVLPFSPAAQSPAPAPAPASVTAAASAPVQSPAQPAPVPVAATVAAAATVKPVAAPVSVAFAAPATLPLAAAPAPSTLPPAPQKAEPAQALAPAPVVAPPKAQQVSVLIQPDTTIGATTAPSTPDAGETV